MRYLNPPPPAQRYERSRPGELVHLDTKKPGRIVHPSHRVTGDRRDKVDGAGWEYAHVAIDDYSRFTYVEILPDEKRYTAARFLLRALRAFRHRGVQVERVLTDNGGAYCSRPFRKACRWLGIAAKRTRPYRPQTNGKAERVIQTLLRKWAYARSYANSAQRSVALGPWLRFYNEERPHATGSINKPPSADWLSSLNNGREITPCRPGRVRRGRVSNAIQGRNHANKTDRRGRIDAGTARVGHRRTEYAAAAGTRDLALLAVGAVALVVARWRRRK